MLMVTDFWGVETCGACPRLVRLRQDYGAELIQGDVHTKLGVNGAQGWTDHVSWIHVEGGADCGATTSGDAASRAHGLRRAPTPTSSFQQRWRSLMRRRRPTSERPRTRSSTSRTRRRCAARSTPRRDPSFQYVLELPVMQEPMPRLNVRAELPVMQEPMQQQQLFFCVQKAEGLTFPVLFLVNALVHKGIINQHQLTPEFLGLLRERDDHDNVAALKDFWGDKLPVFDACQRLTKALDRVSPKLLRCGKDRSHNNTVEELMSHSFKQKTTVHMRVRTFMTSGFHMCGRKYSLLAFSPNQLRDRSAWFFAEDGNTTVESIRQWMGRFTCRNVAKHAARMGQCFSSSYATVTVQPHEVNENLEDIERNGYTFSDGIGKIVPELAMEVAQRLQLTADSPPSAYQIRFGGYKGVIAVWQGESDDGIRLYLRPSMKKFDSDHKESMVGNLEKILTDSDTAFEITRRSCSPENANTSALMLSAGFGPGTEPHLRAMLLAIRSAQLHDLLEKTRIFVPKGRWLIGCLDELGILKYGQCFIRASAPLLDPCLVKRGAKIIVGTVVVAKNPCYHPGDVRILEAVDVPELRHMVDCLVFPQNGERPHPDEASGSDLDGDIYFVTWDDKLISPSKKSWKPMDYSPPEVKLLPREVSQHDTVGFFLENMANLWRCHHIFDQKSTDFLIKEDSKSYKSEKILGRLYRSIQEASGGNWDSNEAWTLHDLPYDSDLEVAGASDFLASAWQCKCSYDRQLNSLLNQYGVRTEAELVTGHIWSLPRNNSRKLVDVKDRLKNAYNAFQKEYRSVFESITLDEVEISDDDEKNQLYEMKASAWYQVTYHPKWTEKSRALLDPDDEEGPDKLESLPQFPYFLSACNTQHIVFRVKISAMGSLPETFNQRTFCREPTLGDLANSLPKSKWVLGRKNALDRPNCGGRCHMAHVFAESRRAELGEARQA
uniref:RNA-dependent RNA polymerase n=1 Tax=Aegilops tauschii TaxID=37682 RepID=N1QZQ3_AEGTA